MIDHTHDPKASTWVEGADSHRDFPVQNLPFGIFSTTDEGPRVGCAIGDYVLDLRALSREGLLGAVTRNALESTCLNELFAVSRDGARTLRHAVFELLTSTTQRDAVGPHLHPVDSCRMHLPFRIGDYTDFYVGIHHATNIGKLLRPDNPLLPNYKHLPIGYHGRASSIRVSGQPVIRPKGQRKLPEQEVPVYGPSQRLDYELEMGVWIAGENQLGEVVPIDAASTRIGGLCLLNDWSARDFQAWEYQPLGPFLAKNFHSTISPWVVTMEALAPFAIAQPARPTRDPSPLDYLLDEGDQAGGALSITLNVTIRSEAMRREGIAPQLLSTGPTSNMYWTIAQMVTHHACGGCNLMPGDLLGSGTISGPERSTFGSLMEISAGGTQPVALPGGEARTFLEDGDEIIISALAQQEGYRSIGFGDCEARVVSAAC